MCSLSGRVHFDHLVRVVSASAPHCEVLPFPFILLPCGPPSLPAWTPAPHTGNGWPPQAIRVPALHAQSSLHTDACPHPALALTLSFPPSRRSLSPTCFPHPTAGAHFTDGHSLFGAGHLMPGLFPLPAHTAQADPLHLLGVRLPKSWLFRDTPLPLLWLSLLPPGCLFMYLALPLLQAWGLTCSGSWGGGAGDERAEVEFYPLRTFLEPLRTLEPFLGPTQNPYDTFFHSKKAFTEP